VAAHGGVPPPGPLLGVLHIEFIVPRPMFSFVGGQKILVGRGIFFVFGNTFGISIEIFQTKL
jgi:hypothetical protein